MGASVFVLNSHPAATAATNHISIKMMSRLILAVAFFAMLAGAYAESCSNCEKDVIAGVTACKGASGQAAIVTCVMDVLKTSADCVSCVCSILADAFKLDSALCA